MTLNYHTRLIVSLHKIQRKDSAIKSLACLLFVCLCNIIVTYINIYQNVKKLFGALRDKCWLVI